MERGYLARRACLDMLPDAPAHLARLAAAIEEHTATLLDLSRQWDAVRLPLLEAINTRLVECDAQEAAFAERSTATRTLHADMTALLADGRAKQQQLQALQREWEAVQAGIAADAASVPGDAAAAAAGGSGAIASVSRSAYTRRVLDVVRSIRKQKAEIGKIVRDVRGVQQEINGISERLGRTSKSAMLTFEKAATEQQGKGETTSLQVLRQAVTLQEAFQRLIAVNSSIGAMDNEIRDLEGRIDSMAQRNDARNTDALRSDLAAFASENQRAEEQLQALGVPIPPSASAPGAV
jgi:coiled-coil domain-containing protein 22